MRKYIVLLMMTTSLLFALKIYDVGEAPWDLEIYRTHGGTYAVILDRGSSSLIMLDMKTGKKRRLQLPSFPTDILVENGKALITCVEKGMLVEVDLNSFKITENKLLGAQIFRFLRRWPSRNGHAILSYDGKVLVVTDELQVSKIFYITPRSLDAALWKRFLVSLKSENYDPIWRKFRDEKGVVFSDLSTGETFNEDAGKIPAYILTFEDELIVISYWDGQITVFDENLGVRKLVLNTRINSPLILGNRIYLLSFDTSELLVVDPVALKVTGRLKLKGRGPVKLKPFEGRLAVLNVLDSSVDIVDPVLLKNLFHFSTGRYPVDIERIDESTFAVLCEEAGELWLHRIEK